MAAGKLSQAAVDWHNTWCRDGGGRSNSCVKSRTGNWEGIRFVLTGRGGWTQASQFIFPRWAGLCHRKDGNLSAHVLVFKGTCFLWKWMETLDSVQRRCEEGRAERVGWRCHRMGGACRVQKLQEPQGGNSQVGGGVVAGGCDLPGDTLRH